VFALVGTTAIRYIALVSTTMLLLCYLPENSSVHVYQRQLLSRAEADDVVRLVKEHTDVYGWTTARHRAYRTDDIAVHQIRALQPLEALLRERMHPFLEEKYGRGGQVQVVDLFVVKYAPEARSGLDLHQDGGQVSFNCLLSHEDAFEGGGTFIPSASKDTFFMGQGQALVHPGSMQHQGVPITKGVRYVLVGQTVMHGSWEWQLKTLTHMWGMWASTVRVESEL
jgi:hypothetical protein